MDEKELHDNYWNSLKKFSPMEAITLRKNCDIKNFQIYGDKLAYKLMEMLNKHKKFDFKESKILEIGCGIGRYIVPFSKEFKTVYGVDISTEIIQECEKYCNSYGIENYLIWKNDGKTLNTLQDNSLEYCFSTGVFQHIVDFSCISNYIKEAIRVLKEGGIFLFQFQAIWKDEIGQNRHGAAITANKLDKELKGLNFRIKEISYDPYDPMRQFVIILEKTKDNKEYSSFKTFNAIPVLFRTAIVDLTDEENCKNWIGFLDCPENRKKITFYD